MGNRGQRRDCYSGRASAANVLSELDGKTSVGIRRQNLMSGDTMSPPGRGTDAAKRQHGCRPADTDTPGGCTRLFGFRPSCSRPAQSSGYAASPIRSASLSAEATPR
jgi:hypothetical protein